MEMYGLGGTDAKIVRKRLQNLAKRGLVKIEGDEALDSSIIGRANLIKRATEVPKRISFYTMNVAPDTFEKAEALTIWLKKNGDRTGCTSVLEAISVLGKESAEDLYPQGDVNNKRYIRTRDIYIDIATKIVKEKGYATPADIITVFRATVKGNQTVEQFESQFNRYRNFFKQSGLFEGVRVNKRYREAFNIPADVSSNTFLLIKKGEA
jgi:hypothetical protein